MEAAISLTELVNTYCIGSFNDERKYFANYLIHAKWAWKKFFRDTYWSIVSNVAEVEQVAPDLYRVKKPKDTRLLSVEVRMANGRTRVLRIDKSIDITSWQSRIKKCTQCGEYDELGACVNNLQVTTKTVFTHANIEYKQKVYREVLATGEIEELTEMPSLDITNITPTVKIVKTRKVIAKLETKPCGCIIKTPENEAKLLDCGCLVYKRNASECYGGQSADVHQLGRIREGKHYIYIQGVVPNYVIINAQTNGESCGDEIMVPESAVDLMIAAIDARAKQLARNVSPAEKREANRVYNVQLLEYQSYLDPIRVEEFLDAQMVIPKWGAVMNEVTEFESAGMVGLEWGDKEVKPPLDLPPQVPPASDGEQQPTDPPPPIDLVDVYYGWADNIPTTKQQLENLQKHIQVSKTGNFTCDFRDNKVPKHIIMAQRKGAVVKTSWYAHSLSFGPIAPGGVFEQIADIEDFEVYVTPGKTLFAYNQVNFLK